MKIYFDSAKVNFNLNKELNHIELTIDTKTAPSGHVNVGPNVVPSGTNNPSGHVNVGPNVVPNGTNNPSGHVNVGPNVIPNGTNNPSGHVNVGPNEVNNPSGNVAQNPNEVSNSSVEASSVRGSQMTPSTTNTSLVLTVASLALLGFSKIDKYKLENFLPASSNKEYIKINNDDVEIIPNGVFNYEVIVKINEEFHNIKQTDKFKTDNIQEIIFTEVKDDITNVLEIKICENGVWNTQSTSKYYDVF